MTRRRWSWNIILKTKHCAREILGRFFFDGINLAYWIYKKIRKEIQKNYLLTALSIITFTTEDDFMDFLKLVEVKYNKRILNGLQKKGWLPSISYILQNTKETEKEDFALS